MTDPIFNDLGLRALTHGLDGLSLRQRATANNIANIDTPNYRAQRVSFENQLQRALHFNEPETELSLKITDQNHLGQQTASKTNLIMVYQQDNEGTSHAKSGHPNAVAVLSYAARAWAADKHLHYDPSDWQKLQEQAIANLREDPGELQLWPPSN